jgi:uncharacterized protein
MGWLDRFRRVSEPERDPMDEALRSAKEGDFQAALAIWEPLARAGNARAQNNIAACFSGGHGLAENPELAAKWLKLSAAQGDPVGQRNLATLHFRGDGIEQDEAEAMRLYRLAADQGDATAQDMYSWMLADHEDYAGSLAYAERAAAQGVAASMTRIGNLHHNALGVERDAGVAAAWWRKAAMLGEADGQAMLGAAHITGAGVPRDPVAALAWLLRARDGGSKLAHNFIPAAIAVLSPEEREAAKLRADRPLLDEGEA